MKKRKSPALLATLLVLLIGGGVAFNVIFQKKPDDPQSPPQEQARSDQKVAESRTPDSKSKIAGELKQAFDSGPMKVRHPEKAGDSGPSIRVQKDAPQSPKTADPNRTSQQWYR